MSNQTNEVPPLNTVDVFSLSLAVLTAVFHAIGIIVMCCLKKKLNQKNILLSLSISEILYCLYGVLWPVKTLKVPRQSLNMFCTLSNKLLMLTLLGDRFLEIYLNLLYPIVITRERLVRVLSSVWTVAGLYGLVVGIVVNIDNSHYYHAYSVHNYIVLVLDTVFTLSAICTYGYFFSKIRDINRKAANRSTGSNGKCSRKFNFKIPFSIIATFLIFNVTSTILFQTKIYLKGKYSILDEKCAPCQFLGDAAYLLIILGFLSDSILYIIMQRPIRRFIRRKVWPLSNVRGATKMQSLH